MRSVFEIGGIKAKISERKKTKRARITNDTLLAEKVAAVNTALAQERDSLPADTGSSRLVRLRAKVALKVAEHVPKDVKAALATDTGGSRSANLRDKTVQIIEEYVPKDPSAGRVNRILLGRSRRAPDGQIDFQPTGTERNVNTGEPVSASKPDFTELDSGKGKIVITTPGLPGELKNLKVTLPGTQDGTTAPEAVMELGTISGTGKDDVRVISAPDTRRAVFDLLTTVFDVNDRAPQRDWPWGGHALSIYPMKQEEDSKV